MRAYSIILAAFIVGFFSNAMAAPLTIVAFGDSLTAGYSLPPQQAFPAVLEAKLRKAGHDVKVINAGVSGETTGQGLTRLDRVLAAKPDIAIVALGANDMLRRALAEQARTNLDTILTRLREAGIYVLLVGLKSPGGMNTALAAYGIQHPSDDGYETMYADLAEKHEVAFHPSFLEGVAGRRDLNLADGLHPNAQGVQVMVDNIFPLVEKMVRRKTE